MGLRRGGAGAVWFKLGDFQRERDHLSGDGGPGPRALERGPFRRGRGEVVAEVIAEVPEAGFEPSPRVGGPNLPAGTVAGAGERSELRVLEAQFVGGGIDQAEDTPFFREAEQTAGGRAGQVDDGAGARDGSGDGLGRVHAGRPGGDPVPAEGAVGVVDAPAGGEGERLGRLFGPRAPPAFAMVEEERVFEAMPG